MLTLKSHLGGHWVERGGTSGETLVNPATEEPLALVEGGAIDGKAALAFARAQGGAAAPGRWHPALAQLDGVLLFI